MNHHDCAEVFFDASLPSGDECAVCCEEMKSDTIACAKGHRIHFDCYNDLRRRRYPPLCILRCGARYCRLHPQLMCAILDAHQ